MTASPRCETGVPAESTAYTRTWLPAVYSTLSSVSAKPSCDFKPAETRLQVQEGAVRPGELFFCAKMSSTAAVVSAFVSVLSLSLLPLLLLLASPSPPEPVSPRRSSRRERVRFDQGSSNFFRQVRTKESKYRRCTWPPRRWS